MNKVHYRTIFLGLALFILLFINNAQAYTLHLILACDQDAGNIGESVMADYKNMKKYFSDSFEQLDLVPLSTRNLTIDSIYKAIESMNVKSSDTVLFYYSGHGAYDYSRGTQLLTLNSGNISRIDLLKKLREKHAKLLIVLTDCCNVIPEGLANIPDSSKMPQRGGNGLEKLFREASGELDITSSRISEFSIGGEDGGYFTKLFLWFLRRNEANGNVEWKDLQKEVQPQLTKMFKNYLGPGRTYIDLKEYGVATPPGMPTIQDDQRMYIYACPGMPLRFGAGVRLVDNQLKVVKVIPNTPAEEAGIEAGDILLEINGSPLETYGDYDILINYSHQRMRLKVKKSDGDIENLNVFLAYE